MFNNKLLQAVWPDLIHSQQYNIIPPRTCLVFWRHSITLCQSVFYSAFLKSKEHINGHFLYPVEWVPPQAHNFPNCQTTESFCVIVLGQIISSWKPYHLSLLLQRFSKKMAKRRGKRQVFSAMTFPFLNHSLSPFR